jgi:hypothetical protein
MLLGRGGLGFDLRTRAGQAGDSQSPPRPGGAGFFRARRIEAAVWSAARNTPEMSVIRDANLFEGTEQ